MSEKVYHIYAKDRCLYHNLKREDFEEKWEMLRNMVGLMKTDYSESDLQFVEISDKVGGAGNGSFDDNLEPSY